MVVLVILTMLLLSMYLDASAKDDRDRERRQFNIEESRHKEALRRSCELEDTVCSAVTRAASELMEAQAKESGCVHKRRRVRTLVRRSDGTAVGREVLTEVRKR